MVAADAVVAAANAAAVQLARRVVGFIFFWLSFCFVFVAFRYLSLLLIVDEVRDCKSKEELTS